MGHAQTPGKVIWQWSSRAKEKKRERERESSPSPWTSLHVPGKVTPVSPGGWGGTGAEVLRGACSSAHAGSLRSAGLSPLAPRSPAGAGAKQQLMVQHHRAGTVLCPLCIQSPFIPLWFVCVCCCCCHCCLFCLLRAAPRAYGSSQAKGQIGAAAASLGHSHSKARSKSCLQPTPQLKAARILNPLNEARDPTTFSWILVEFVAAEPREELPPLGGFE